MPQISVIVPCYNADESMLNDCVASILTQTFQDFEVILVDDGSADDYHRSILKIKEIDNRIRVLTQTNQGCAAARNNGVAIAEGKFVVFVDADDMLTPDFFFEILKIQESTDADFVIGGNIFLDQYQDLHEQSFSDSKIELLTTQEEKNAYKPYLLTAKQFGDQGSYIGRGPWCRLIRKTIAKDNPFPEELSIGEDIAWNLKLFSENIKICIVYRVWYLYRKHSQSAVRRYNENIVECLEQELSTFRPLLDWTDDEQYIAYCSRMLWDLKQVYTNYLGRKECQLNRKERNRLIHHIYTQSPWVIFGEKRLRKTKKMSRHIKIRSYLYKCRCLFLSFQLKTKAKNFFNRA